MTAGIYNLLIEQGADFSRVLTWKDADDALINLTGYTARMKIKRNIDAAVIADLTTTPNANGDKLTLGGAAGTITIFISAASTAAFNFESGRYDLELISSGGLVTRLIQGVALLDQETTV